MLYSDLQKSVKCIYVCNISSVVVSVPCSAPLTCFKEDNLVILAEVHEAVDALGKLHYVLDGVGDVHSTLLPHPLSRLHTT